MLRSGGASREFVHLYNLKKNVQNYVLPSMDNIKLYILYAFLAIPQNWILMYVLYAQIPFFINNYPGGISVATYV